MRNEVKILVVDSDPEELYRACEILRGMDIDHILCASNCEDATHYLNTYKDISIVIADTDGVVKSAKDTTMVCGESLLGLVKSYQPSTVFIGQTSSVTSEGICLILLEGADDFVDKRRTPSHLFKKLPRWINVAECNIRFKAAVGV